MNRPRRYVVAAIMLLHLGAIANASALQRITLRIPDSTLPVLTLWEASGTNEQPPGNIKAELGPATTGFGPEGATLTLEGRTAERYLVDVRYHYRRTVFSEGGDTLDFDGGRSCASSWQAVPSGAVGFRMPQAPPPLPGCFPYYPTPQALEAAIAAAAPSTGQDVAWWKQQIGTLSPSAWEWVSGATLRIQRKQDGRWTPVTSIEFVVTPGC